MHVPICFLFFSIGAVSRSVRSATVIPPTSIQGESIANFHPFTPNNSFTGIDGPNVKPINDTVFDWWYFDVVALPNNEDTDGQSKLGASSNDSLASMVITLFTSTNEAFPFLPPTAHSNNSLTAYIWVTFPNGTWVSRYAHADKATVGTPGGGGSSGEFESTGFSWSGAKDMSRYTIRVDAEDGNMGMKGVMEMESITPPRIPCSSLENAPLRDPPNGLRPLEVAPELGWANPIPDAIGKVDFTIDGSRLQFHGTAYHDKNWSPRPFDPALESWYWGHARVGPYSVVWFDLVTGGERFVSAYVSRRGADADADTEGESMRVLVSGCDAGSVDVSPREAMEEGNFRVQFGIEEGEKELVIDVSPVSVIAGLELDGIGYVRWAGRVIGRVTGGEGENCDDKEEYEGTSVYEQFVKISGNKA